MRQCGSVARAKATSIKLSQFPHFEDSVAQNVVVCFSAEAFYIISISAEFLNVTSPPPHLLLPPAAAWLALSVALALPSLLPDWRKFANFPIISIQSNETNTLRVRAGATYIQCESVYICSRFLSCLLAMT